MQPDSAILQPNLSGGGKMTSRTKRILQVISFIGLALSLIPAFLVFNGMLSREIYFHLMVAGMLMWFGTAVFWIKKDHLG
jgi:hypothetical protein